MNQSGTKSSETWIVVLVWGTPGCWSEIASNAKGWLGHNGFLIVFNLCSKSQNMGQPSAQKSPRQKLWFCK